ncbi:penicillin-binding protein activator [Sedimentitalea arenosa]|jgi:ABC-type branched-subunit amino acid transport system substrate-binding protein|uniref:Penicillin-binding protein activator n=1 Tax=Sedimentitalea arenosa TaxID=2798803 RepID=A0A8J7J9W9_9RHOB|nr:penicillin-binding protein activator [Arenibacterium arenosum]MBJ6371189.1 penicillin-binding protein activator [Arenibacterium arenosum]
MFAVFALPRKVALRWLALFALLFLAACETGPVGGPTINTNAPVPVALLVPQNSGQAGDALLARSLENAARLAIGDLNGVQIDLRVYDTGGNATTAAAQATQAVNDGARIILGPLYAEATNAVGLAVRGQNVNVLSFSNNPTIAGGNVFVLGQLFDTAANRLTRYAVRQGKGDIVIVHGTDLSGQLGRDAIRNAISGSGARLVGTVPYDLSQQAVIATVPQVRSAVESGAATSIFLTSTTAGALPLFTQLLPESGVSPATTQYIGLTRWDIPPQTLALPGVQGGWFAMPDPTQTQQFNARYAAAYGGAPHPIGGLAYDGIAAIGALVGAGKADALTGGALTQSAGFQGVNGIFRLRPDGTNERGLAVATIQNKQVVVIDPAPRSFSGAGF